MTPDPENEVAPALTEAERADLASEIDGTEDLLGLLKDAANAMHDAVPQGVFVDVRPLQEAVLEAWVAARVAAAVAPALALADEWEQAGVVENGTYPETVVGAEDMCARVLRAALSSPTPESAS